MGDEQARDDLAMIRRLMEDGRRVVTERGTHFIIWGAAPAVGALATYAYISGAAVPNPGIVWSVILALGWLASSWVGWRGSRSARVRTTARRLLTGVWVSAAVSLTLISMAGTWGGVVRPEALPGVLSAIMAAPIAVTMLLTGERWLGAVAVGWWVGGATMLFVQGPYTLLVMAAMSVLLLMVPGIVLNARARRSGSPGPDGALADPA